MRVVFILMRTESSEPGEGEVEKAMAQAVEETRLLYDRVQDKTASHDVSWFGRLLLGILRSALLDYYSVEVGTKNSVYIAAWGCRNLLELKVITKYVLASQANAPDFKHDLLIDAKEFYDSLSKAHQASHTEYLKVLEEMSKDDNNELKDLLKSAFLEESIEGPETETTDSEAD
ncbi:hypothetical protein [Tunturiibacter psychrotolerans]|uniref:hypothetical protein n=1 Tax=Tunturiibacter psychrotolerans TaxID=3069686 RepID=UPI003D1A2064